MVWWRSRRGRAVCTSVSDGALYRIDLATGSFDLLADVGGGANGAAAASDGGFLVAQNGGLDFEAVGLFEAPPPHRPAQPGLQRVAPDGSVSSLTPDVCRAPNDLAVAADGTVYFTDPPPWPLPEAALGRIWRTTQAVASRSSQTDSGTRTGSASSSMARWSSSRTVSWESRILAPFA